MYFKCQSISQADQKLLMKNYRKCIEDNETFFVTKQIASEK